MIKAGVKIGWLDKIVTFIRPRPGNKYTNSKAYLEMRRKNSNFFKFNEK